MPLQPFSRFIELLRVTFDLTMEEATDYARTLIPTVLLGTDGPEDVLMSGQRLAWGGGSVVAAAGQRSELQFENPTSTDLKLGTLIITESIVIGQALAGRLSIAILPNTTLLTFAAQGIQRDTRPSRESNVMNVGIIGRFNTRTGIGQTAGGFTFAGFQTQAGGSHYITAPCVLAPGHNIIVQPNVDNSEVSMHVAWREVDLVRR